MAVLPACTDDDVADVDASGSDAVSDADDADTDVSVVPTELYRAKAISESFDPSALQVRTDVDFGDRELGVKHEELYESDDGGETWTLVPSPFTFPSEKVHRELVINEETGSVFAFSTSMRLYRSDDRGETFIELDSPFAINGSGVYRQLFVGADGAIWAFAMRTQYAVENYGLAVSTDDGETFESVELPFEESEGASIAASQGLRFFTAPSGNVFLSVKREKFYRTSIGAEWELVDGITFVLDEFVTESGIVLVTFRDSNTNVQMLALSTDGGESFEITEESEPRGLKDTFVQLEDDTLLRINLRGQLRVLSADGTSWDEAIETYPAALESPYVETVTVDGNTIELAFEFDLLSWTKGDDEWTILEPPPVIPLASKVVDITVIASGKAAVIVTKNKRSIIYLSDDGGETWRRGQRFDEGVLTLAMKPEGDIIFVGGGLGRAWLLDGDGFLPEGTDPSTPSFSSGILPILQSAWTPNFGRNSYLFFVSSNPEDTDGALIRATYYTSLSGFTEIDPLRDPLYPQRENPAGMHSVQYSETSVSVGLRQYVGGLARQDRLMTATSLRDWSDSPTAFDDGLRPVAFGTPLSMTSRTSENCKMFGQLYSDGRLYNGGFPISIVEGLPIAGATINDIECGPGGVWWVATSFGLYELERVAASGEN